MDLQLKGKTAFISGSTSGIGLAVARSLSGEGCNVILNGRSSNKVNEVRDSLRMEFPEVNIEGYAADFSDSGEVSRLAARLGHIDILINNVGIFTSSDFLKTEDEDWLRLFEVNVLGGVRLSRVALPGMLARNDGRIIFISSECAGLVPSDLIAYSTTKTALHALSRGLAQLTTGTSVTVNTVMPGSTLTEGATRFLEDQAAKSGKTVEESARDFFDQERTTSLIRRFASPDEIAVAVTYLASPLSAATNGAVLKADGGSVPGVF